jgi:hypothetical protein
MITYLNGHLVQILNDNGVMASVVDIFGNTYSVLSSLLG